MTGLVGVEVQAGVFQIRHTERGVGELPPIVPERRIHVGHKQALFSRHLCEPFIQMHHAGFKGGDDTLGVLVRNMAVRIILGSNHNGRRRILLPNLVDNLAQVRFKGIQASVSALEPSNPPIYEMTCISIS